MLIQTQVDFISIYKDYLSKIGVDMSLNVLDPGVDTQVMVNRSHTQMITGDTAPVAIFYNGQQISGVSHNNLSMVNDPFINDALGEIRLTAISDIHQAMAQYKDLTKYVVDQAYVIPAVTSGYHTLWWPWVKNYSGELNIGYDDATYPTFVWYDQSLKKSIGK